MFNKILTFGLLGLSALLVVLYFLGVVNEDVMLYWAYALTAVTIVFAIVFPIVDVVRHPKKLVRTLIFAAVTAVLVAACYAVSSPHILGLNKELAAQTSASVIQWTETGIYGLYILFALTVAAIIFTEIKNALK